MTENNKTISEQEIEEIIKEISHKIKSDDKIEQGKSIEEENIKIKNIQKFVENESNHWLLEKLTDEQLKKEFIKLLYNREHLTGRLLTELREKHLLSEENKTLGKMVLEIILKYSEKNYSSEVKSDLEIFSLLCGADWREKTGFSVNEEGIGWKGVHSYRAKPQEIVEKYYFKQEEKNEKRLSEKEEKIKAFEKMILEEKDISNQISSLNKLYKNETEKLECLIQAYIEERKEKKLSDLILKNNKEKVEKLEKELAEKKILIEKLEIKEKEAKSKEENERLKEQNIQTTQIEVNK